MNPTPTDQEAITAAETLRKYCTVDRCESGKCIFSKEAEEGECPLRNSTPNRWKIPTLPRWTENDKAIATALKDLGAKTIFRKYPGQEDYALPVWDNSIATGKLPPQSFRGLRAGERVSVDEIINEK